MAKILVVTALSLFIASTAAAADIFRCKAQNDAIVFTDTPTQASADCTREQVKELPIINVAPKPARGDLPVQNSTGIAPSTPNNIGTTSFENFQNEVDELVAQFHSARYRVFQAGLIANKLQARRELTEIRARKQELQNEIEGAALSYGEKQELTEKLADITTEANSESSSQ